MKRLVHFYVVAATAAALAAAQPNFIVSESAVTPSKDAHSFTFDTLITNQPANDAWTASGVVAHAIVGKWFFVSDTDPNTGQSIPNILAPGTAVPNRFASFVSIPRNQTADNRFINSPVGGSSTFALGSYIPATPAPIVNDHEFNVAWGANPPNFNLLNVNAAIMRLTLDLNDRPDIASVVVNGSGELLATVNLALGSRNGAGDLQLITIRLNKGVPEPGSIGLLVMGGMLMIRRR